MILRRHGRVRCEMLLTPQALKTSYEATAGWEGLLNIKVEGLGGLFGNVL